jgi:HAD superfamily hydrolase (TIGR01509 family)
MHVLSVPGDLPVQRGDVTAFDLASIGTITFDFGNTLVPVDRAGLRRVVEATGEAVVERLGPFELDDFLSTWAQERERQFREEVPQFREVDLAERFVRVIARIRGMPPPGDDERWDQAAAAALSSPEEIDWAVDAYSGAFVRGMPIDPAVERALATLARRASLAILSNWPFALTIDRYAEAAGWLPHLRAIVISQRVGAIKPHPDIFAEARRLLGDPDPATILHVGDDWAADVVGAARAGWRTAFVARRPLDSPLPGSDPDGSVVPNLEIDSVSSLAALFELAVTTRPR